MTKREYENCLKRNKIKLFSRGKSLVGKEIEASEADFLRAKKTLEEEDYKWATVQIYYSMFHIARALLYAKNLREHSHYCLIKAIKFLYVDTKEIPTNILDAFQEAKNLREDADYYCRWSEAGCKRLLKNAEHFLEVAKTLLNR